MTGPARLYGIDTCDQVRRARSWLRANQIAFVLHDFRRDGLDAILLGRWMSHLPWDALLNRRGLSWRQVDASRRATIVDQTSAVELMLEVPTLVRRPILEHGDRILVGFSEPMYSALFAAGIHACASSPHSAGSEPSACTAPSPSKE
jgi:arsenate reductase